MSEEIESAHEGCGQPWRLCTCCDLCDQPRHLCDCTEEDDE